LRSAGRAVSSTILNISISFTFIRGWAIMKQVKLPIGCEHRWG
jgi:hypothetical protein